MIRFANDSFYNKNTRIFVKTDNTLIFNSLIIFNVRETNKKTTIPKYRIYSTSPKENLYKVMLKNHNKRVLQSLFLIIS